MPYKCNVCGKTYQETSSELRDVMLRGSCSCGKRFLMYVRKNLDESRVRFDKSPEEKIMEPSPYLPKPGAAVDSIVREARDKPTEVSSPYLPQVEKKEEAKPAAEKGPLDWLERSFTKVAPSEEPVYLSIETIKILEEGKYQIDVTSLMGGKPIVVKDENGVYYIDVPYAMKKKEK
jgi:predicted  nucleic acid-binding Zn-ribbon protein